MARDNTVTLTDVAKAAGVSAATVSRVLNKQVNINGNTRSRVFSAIERLGYNTSAIDRKAAALAQSKVKVLNIEFLLCPLIEQSNLLSLGYFNEIFNGVQSFFGQTGNINLSLATWEADEKKYRRQNESILKRLIQADGVLLTGNPSAKLVESLKANRISPVLVSNDNDALEFNTITVDNISGGIQAARYLLDCGHVKIGFLDAGADRIATWTKRKIGAMVETTTRVGAENFISRSSVSTDASDVAECLRKWFDEDGLPDALIIPYSCGVIALERVLFERKLHCPEDLSVFSFDHFESNAFQIKATHLHTYPRQMGIKAAQRLIQILKFPYSEEMSHNVIVPMKLVEGNSVMKK